MSPSALGNKPTRNVQVMFLMSGISFYTGKEHILFVNCHTIRNGRSTLKKYILFIAIILGEYGFDTKNINHALKSICLLKLLKLKLAGDFLVIRTGYQSRRKEAKILLCFCL